MSRRPRSTPTRSRQGSIDSTSTPSTTTPREHVRRSLRTHARHINHDVTPRSNTRREPHRPTSYRPADPRHRRATPPGGSTTPPSITPTQTPSHQPEPPHTGTSQATTTTGGYPLPPPPYFAPEGIAKYPRGPTECETRVSVPYPLEACLATLGLSGRVIVGPPFLWLWCPPPPLFRDSSLVRAISARLGAWVRCVVGAAGHWWRRRREGRAAGARRAAARPPRGRRSPR